MLLVFDTETTGMPKSWNASWKLVDNWPRLVQIAWLPFSGTLQPIDPVRIECRLIKPDGYEIPPGATEIHGISHEMAEEHGEQVGEVLAEFCRWLLAADAVIGHNVDFDVNVVCSELARLIRPSYAERLFKTPRIDTMKAGTDVCKIPGFRGYKWPKLNELHRHLFHADADDQHRADGDVLTTAKCFCELRRLGKIPA